MCLYIKKLLRIKRHLMKDDAQIIIKMFFFMVSVNEHKHKHIVTEIQTWKQFYHLFFTLNNIAVAFRLQVLYYIAYGLLF
jgi:hypothetical protein